jgi:CRP-like cAMP-binding protein
MRLLVVPGSAFRKLLKKAPTLAERLLATMSARLRAADAAGDC